MSHHQVLLANLVGKSLADFFVPADGKAVTLLLNEGRSSLGAPVVRTRSALWADGQERAPALITALNYPEPNMEVPVNTLTIVTNRGELVVDYEGAQYLVELPE